MLLFTTHPAGLIWEMWDGMGRRERRALEERWRVERRRSMPSESAVFRYLERFHEAGEGVQSGSSQSVHTFTQRSAGGSA